MPPIFPFVALPRLIQDAPADPVILQASTVGAILADPSNAARCYVDTLAENSDPIHVDLSPADVAFALINGTPTPPGSGPRLIGCAIVKGDGSGVFLGNVAVLGYALGSGLYKLQVTGLTAPPTALQVSATCMTPGAGTAHPVCATAAWSAGSDAFELQWQMSDGSAWPDLTFMLQVFDYTP